MIDTHSHLDNEQFDNDRDEVIARAFNSGVEAIIIPSIDPGNFDAVKRLTEKHTQIYRGIGIHPHHAHEAKYVDFERIENETADSKVVAIGEIGLDYYYNFAPRETQQEVFRRQLRIAKRVGKPVIVHNRDSDDDMLKILTEEQDGSLSGVMHCFSGYPAMLNEIIRLRMHVSFTGNITYKKSILGDTVAAAPLNKLMLETDAPYMSPVPYRGKRNEPSHVRLIAEKIAEIHSTTLENIYSMTTSTAKKLFRIPILIAFLLLAAAPICAQNSGNPRDEEYDNEEVQPPNPYKKSLGIGATVATNTIIDFQECTDSRRISVSYDGILSFGGSLNYGLFDFLTIDASYIYSHNNNIKVTKYRPEGDHYNFASIGARFVANSNKRIGLFALAGASMQWEKLGQRVIDSDAPSSVQKFGLDVGVGFEVHLETGAGMIVPTAEWRVIIPFGSEQISNNPTFCSGSSGLLSRMYSIPRFTVYWFPKF